MVERFVIVGGDAAGMSAASKAKRDNPELDVIVFERNEWVSYAACGLPYYIKGSVETLEDLVSVTPKEFREERDIDLRTGHEVVGIDPDAKTVTVESEDDWFEQPYDALLIGTGARAVEPPIDGIDLDGVFTLRGMNQGDEIETFVRTRDPQHATIVGGGYVGVEMAEALAAHDIKVSMFEMLPHILQPFGQATAEVVEAHLRERGVDLHLETAVDRFVGEGSVEAVAVGSERPPADLAIIGVGVAPNVDIAEDGGIELGTTGAIAMDDYGRTNYQNVYAAGDCAETINAVTGAPDHVPLGLTANRAGRAIGATVAGTPTPVGTITGTAILKAFDLGVARTGILDEERARDAGFEPTTVTIEAPTRPHYYPGTENLHVTLVADESSKRVLGASLVGKEGAKRIDTVATAIEAELTVSELERLDLAYAPPFSPVWDPILIAAKVLAGQMERDVA